LDQLGVLFGRGADCNSAVPFRGSGLTSECDERASHCLALA